MERGADRRLEDRARASVEVAEIPGRRLFIRAGIAAAVGAFAVRKPLSMMEDRSVTQHVEKERGLPDTKEWEPSELTENWVDSFEGIHGVLHGDAIVLIDQNGNIIDGE